MPVARIEPIYINRWWTGLHTNRSPLVTPYTYTGLQRIERYDALIDGLNVECNPQQLLQRRFGFSRWSNALLAADERPRTFYGFRDSAGTIRVMADVESRIIEITPTNKTIIAPVQGRVSFQSVLDTLYFVDGESPRKIIFGQPVIINGKFESDTGSNTPNGWTKSLRGAEMGTTTEPNISYNITTPYAGAVSLRLNATNRYRGLATKMYPASPGSRWKLSAAIRETAGTMQGRIYVAFYNASDHLDASNNVVFDAGKHKTGFQIINASFDEQWIKSEVVATCPADADRVALIIDCEYTGGGAASDTTWEIDEIGLEEVGVGVFKMGLNTPLPMTATSIEQLSGSQNPSVGWRYTYAYKNSRTGHVSTAAVPSPSSKATANMSVRIFGKVSQDPQVDKIVIFRTKDGGSTFFQRAEIQNIGVGGVANPTWAFMDDEDDTILNESLVAALNKTNDPLPNDTQLLTFHAGRLWAAAGNKLMFAAGPDVLIGNPDEAWPPANVFVFPGIITAMQPTNIGLIVFTVADAWIVGGSDRLSFHPQLWMAKLGVPTPNCVVLDGETLYVYTSQLQLWSVNLSEIDEIGFPVGNLLQTEFRH